MRSDTLALCQQTDLDLHIATGRRALQDLTVEIAADLIDAQHAGVWLFCGDKNVLVGGFRIEGLVGLSVDPRQLPHDHVSLLNGSPSSHPENDFVNGTLGNVRSVVVVPLLAGEDFVGVVILGLDRLVRTLSEADLSYLEQWTIEIEAVIEEQVALNAALVEMSRVCGY